MTELKTTAAIVFSLLLMVLISLTFNVRDVWAGENSDSCVGKTYLPSSYQIEPPSSNVPNVIAEYSGMWVGYWKDGEKDALCHILIVEEVSPNGEAQVIYSIGTYSPWRIYKEKYYRFTGTITSGELSFVLQNGRRVSYRINKDELMGNYGYGRSMGLFKKQRG